MDKNTRDKVVAGHIHHALRTLDRGKRINPQDAELYKAHDDEVRTVLYLALEKLQGRGHR